MRQALERDKGRSAPTGFFTVFFAAGLPFLAVLAGLAAPAPKNMAAGALRVTVPMGVAGAAGTLNASTLHVAASKATTSFMETAQRSCLEVGGNTWRRQKP